MIKNNLKKIRMSEYLMTGKEFAEMLNVGRTTYSNWEVGNSRPNLDIALEIAKKLNRNVNDIWYLD